MPWSVGLLANSSLATVVSNLPGAASLPREPRRLCPADAVQGSHRLSLHLTDTPGRFKLKLAIPVLSTPAMTAQPVRVRVHTGSRLMAEPDREFLRQDDAPGATAHPGNIEGGTGASTGTLPAGGERTPRTLSMDTLNAPGNDKQSQRQHSWPSRNVRRD